MEVYFLLMTMYSDDRMRRGSFNVLLYVDLYV